MLRGFSLIEIQNKSLYLRGLSPIDDEQDLINKLDPGQLLSVPQVVVHRHKETQIVEQFNNSFADFLQNNDLIKYLPVTIFDFKKDYVTASFKVEDQDEAKALV